MPVFELGHGSTSTSAGLQQQPLTGFPCVHRYLTWRERLFLEEDAGCGFDSKWCESSGFKIEEEKDGPTIRLMDMGPKLLLSNASTAHQSVLRWRLRVTGNTAVEFGVIPVDLDPNQNSLHKTDSVRGDREQRCVGFCSQITAGSHLPVKVPIVRGTMVDLVARRGHIHIVLIYPKDAQEIKWNRDGHPVPSPYLGPKVLRFELDFPASYDVKLAVTCWAKASFDILHEGIEKTYAISNKDEVLGSQATENMEIEPVCSSPKPCYATEAMQRASSAPDVFYQQSTDIDHRSKAAGDEDMADATEKP